MKHRQNANDIVSHTIPRSCCYHAISVISPLENQYIHTQIVDNLDRSCLDDCGFVFFFDVSGCSRVSSIGFCSKLEIWGIISSGHCCFILNFGGCLIDFALHRGILCEFRIPGFWDFPRMIISMRLEWIELLVWRSKC
ncbi:hypothetical protein AKJ16_DCAP17310 [Drosera capensis]